MTTGAETDGLADPTANKRLDGRVAIVTGGGRGIGRSIAMLFARHGAKVLIATRSGSYGQSAVAEIKSVGGEAEAMEVALDSVDAAKSVIERASELWGGLDIIVHNSSSTRSGLLTELADDAFQELFDSSANTAFWLMKHGFPLLRKSSAGRVILTSSVAAERSQNGYAVYGSVKGALNALVRGAAYELGPHGITVNAVAPGGTRSETFDANMRSEMREEWEQMIPLRRIGEAADVARAMLFLASDEASYLTGDIIRVDGGQSLGQKDPW